MSSLARLPHSSVALGPAVEVFLDDRDLAVSTRRVYELTLAALASDLGADIEVASITRDDLRSFLHARHGTAAAKTWNRVVATLGSFFAYCSRQGWVAVSPAVGLERHRERADRVQVGRTRAIPLEELEAFLGAPGHVLRERLLWRMLYETAARALKRRISDAMYRQLTADAKRQAGPGGQAGTTPETSVTGPTPTAGSSVKPQPGPDARLSRLPPPPLDRGCHSAQCRRVPVKSGCRPARLPG